MADDDDLDKLLDEVENKYCQPHPGAKGAACRTAGDIRKEPGRSRNTGVNVSADEDIDNLIEDILDVPLYGYNKVPETKPFNQKPSKTPNQTQSKKCCPVYIGGTIIPFGVGTNISERNSMPEHSKLQSKMIRKKGTRAYACQCSWRSAQQLTDLCKEHQLRWVCGKHSE
ncbi:cilia- and flagella-associated protein 418 isoform X2 [Pyxicephalus adspersus]|uniref:cilia- and flagella-associated protein 418 isoform X2 n=1 Tax=Pyxicephalus adspersus TaxID=30357 RepID=UPI003B5A9203